MTTEKTYSRRRFLGGACAAVGALSVPSAFSAFGSEVAAAEGTGGFSMGVLAPRSSIYPRVGKSLLAGLGLGLGSATRLALHEVGGVASAREAGKALLSSGVTLGVALLAPEISAALDGLFEEEDGVCVGLDVGANVPRAGDALARSSNTLALWQGAFSMGAWAARNVGERAVLVSSFYDAGYDAPYAFRLGFEGAGGEVLESRVTHVPPEGSDLGKVVREISSRRPDLVYASYCGTAAVEFVRAYAAGAKGIPLLGPAFLTDENALAAQGSAALGVRTAATWSPALGGRGNAIFSSAYRKKTGRAPDAFAMLGYETARMVSAALAGSGGKPRGGSFVSALQGASVSGPRGSVSMAAEGRALYVRQVRKGGGKLVNAIVSPLEEAAGEETASLRSELKTGWVNSYLGV